MGTMTKIMTSQKEVHLLNYGRSYSSKEEWLAFNMPHLT
jgi:hypothetical protein